MTVTLKDISIESGFSVTTVSRALGGYDDVSEKTRRHILQIAENLGYQPNLVARQLQGKRTNTIGLLMPQPSHEHADDFFSLLVKGITYAAARHHYDLLISANPPGESELDAYRRIAGGRRVDGMLLARVYRNDPRIQYLQQINFPFMVFGHYERGVESNFPYIEVDNEAGIYALTQHFINYGHQHIGFIASPTELTFTSYRMAGYQTALADNDLPFTENHIAYGDLSRESGQRAANQLLEQIPDLTAIICANDMMALGAMAAIQERNLLIGQDIALGGYDDIPAALHANPPLTTIRQPIYDIGELMTERLLQLIQQPTVADAQLLLQPELIIRESSGTSRS